MTLFHGSVIFLYISALNWFMNILLSQMFAYDKTFDHKVFLGHCDLISWFSDFALYLILSYFFLIMNEYDQTFNTNILIGHYDLISWFSDFALYLNISMGI